MTEHTFIKQPELLEEDYRVDDLLDFSANISSLRKQFSRITKNSVVGLVGPYGCGKSTLLYQIHKENKSNNKGDDDTSNNKNDATADKDKNTSLTMNNKWFIFDAWKYPERKDLWDGFVIEFANSMSEKILEKIKDEIDGNKNNKKKTMIKTASGVAEKIPIAGVIAAPIKEILINKLSSPPIKRVFEFQELFERLIHEIEQDIYIVIEDIDRSGDKGIFFLETLRYFIKNIDSKKKITVIVPMGDEVFEEAGNSQAKNSYLKILDYQIPFNPQDIKFDKFINEVINIEEFSNSRNRDRHGENFVEIIDNFFRHTVLINGEGTIRDIKYLLRKANNKYKDLKESFNGNIEPMLILLFIANEYFYIKNNKEDIHCFETFMTKIEGQDRYQDYKSTQIYIMPANHWLYEVLFIYLGIMWDNGLIAGFIDSNTKRTSCKLIFRLSPKPSTVEDLSKYVMPPNISPLNIDAIGFRLSLNEQYLDLIPPKLRKKVDGKEYALSEKK